MDVRIVLELDNGSVVEGEWNEATDDELTQMRNDLGQILASDRGHIRLLIRSDAGYEALVFAASTHITVLQLEIRRGQVADPVTGLLGNIDQYKGKEK
jgi:multidrug resistance efflux pump